MQTRPARSKEKLKKCIIIQLAYGEHAEFVLLFERASRMRRDRTFKWQSSKLNSCEPTEAISSFKLIFSNIMWSWQGHESSPLVWTVLGKLQTIGFMGPAVTLLCLNYASTPTTAATLMTAALSLSSFSQAGFMLNMQVSSTPQNLGIITL